MEAVLCCAVHAQLAPASGGAIVQQLAPSEDASPICASASILLHAPGGIMWIPAYRRTRAANGRSKLPNYLVSGFCLDVASERDLQHSIEVAQSARRCECTAKPAALASGTGSLRIRSPFCMRKTSTMHGPCHADPACRGPRAVEFERAFVVPSSEFLRWNVHITTH